MKESYTISRYVNLWHSNEAGEKGELFMEAQMSPRMCVGKNLIVRTVELTPKEIDLGVVERGHNYVKKEFVTIKTDKGWWMVTINKDLTYTLGDLPEFMDCFYD